KKVAHGYPEGYLGVSLSIQIDAERFITASQTWAKIHTRQATTLKNPGKMIIPDISTMANRLRRARLLRGLTQETLAQRLAIHAHTVKRWEKRGRMHPENLPRVAEALGVPPLWLATGEGPEPSF
ncbi:MAG TPA: helix-turn-helix domain-containing protein, partial [Holophaga sp.]|nr:helix-turn-helix domain-containing protein [Holophaga sp.]